MSRIDASSLGSTHRFRSWPRHSRCLPWLAVLASEERGRRTRRTTGARRLPPLLVLRPTPRQLKDRDSSFPTASPGMFTRGSRSEYYTVSPASLFEREGANEFSLPVTAAALAGHDSKRVGVHHHQRTLSILPSTSASHRCHPTGVGGRWSPRLLRCWPPYDLSGRTWRTPFLFRFITKAGGPTCEDPAGLTGCEAQRVFDLPLFRPR